MCSINDCNFDGNDDKVLKNTKDLSTDAIICRKCKCKNVDVLLVDQSGYCNVCFLNVINHKFRAALGKSKIIRHGDSILVDHSGELNSTVLLHLIKAGMNESTHKKLIFKTTVLYIHDDIMTKKTHEERVLLECKIAKEVKDFGFNGYAVSISQVLNKEDALDVRPIDQEINNENDSQLQLILTNLLDDTSRMDLVDQLRRKLLLSAARILNCNKIFVADSAVDIATKVLGDICLGRGAQLSTQANFCDARCEDIKILKPMRDFTQQELIYYSEYHKINFVKLKEPNMSTITSIQALAHNFTMGLESQFSGTVSTVFRTADKISSKGDMQQNVEDNCVLCDTRLDFTSSDDKVTAIRAIEVSRLVSSKHIDAKAPLGNEENGKSNCFDSRPNNECCDGNTKCECRDSKKKQVTMKDVWSYLCYSCRLIFRNSELSSTLPSSLLFAIQQRVALKNMREEINDFLL
ncbi:hypothetical protein P5V15_012515 [Pogonomyrmex californicus]